MRTYNSVDYQPARTVQLFAVLQRSSYKALLEHHKSLYPSNTRPLPNLRKCKSSVNKAEAAPLQFSLHSGGEGSISGESMVSLWLTHSKGSGEEGGEEVRACLQRPQNNTLNTTVQYCCDTYHSSHLIVFSGFHSF